MPSKALSIWTAQVVGGCGHVCSAWPLIKRSGSLFVMCDECQGTGPDPVLVAIRKDYMPVEEELVGPVKARKAPVKRAPRKPVKNVWLNL